MAVRVVVDIAVAALRGCPVIFNCVIHVALAYPYLPERAVRVYSKVRVTNPEFEKRLLDSKPPDCRVAVCAEEHGHVVYLKREVRGLLLVPEAVLVNRPELVLVETHVRTGEVVYEVNPLAWALVKPILVYQGPALPAPLCA